MVSQSLYKAWGENRSDPGMGTQLTDYGYTGQRKMNDSVGLIYYGARFYDSYLNRWASPDSIIPNSYNPQDFDRYSYVRNNPVKNTDPTGHISCEECVEGGGQEIPLIDPVGPVDEAAGLSEVADVVPDPGETLETFDTEESTSESNLPEQLTNDAETNDAENNVEENNNPESKAPESKKPGIKPPEDRNGLRKNMNKAGIQKPDDMTKAQAHHLLPWKFNDWFASKGINANSAEYGEWVQGSPDGPHQEWSSDYNSAWKNFIVNHPNATQQEIEDYMNQLNDSGDYPDR
jgi:RHS repeat-associated protein